ncbi:MAG: hypothetical protein IIA00_06740 [Proteobacteria bacterium]|nr:hypothetical protein [Pseudomonadota bacterium]
MKPDDAGVERRQPPHGGGPGRHHLGQVRVLGSEACLIEDAKVGPPVKGAALVGAYGNDMRLDSGIGARGRNGQGVPVGVGRPSLVLDASPSGERRLHRYPRGPMWSRTWTASRASIGRPSRGPGRV